jgi:effector-binding domain-containing protein
MATTEPKLEQRDERHYVAVRRRVKMRELGTVLPPLGEVVFTWLKKQGVAPAGAPFFRYLYTDMEGEGQFEVEVAVPVETPLTGEGEIVAGVLPAGRYATLVNTGPYHDLIGAHTKLMAWAAENGVVLDRSEDGMSWGAQYESYETEPDEEPDPQKWQTEIAYLVKEA